MIMVLANYRVGSLLDLSQNDTNNIACNNVLVINDLSRYVLLE